MAKPKGLLAISFALGVATLALALTFARTHHKLREAERYAGSALAGWRRACTAIVADLRLEQPVSALTAAACVPPDQASHIEGLLDVKQYATAANEIFRYVDDAQLPIVANDRDIDSLDMPRGYER